MFFFDAIIQKIFTIFKRLLLKEAFKHAEIADLPRVTKSSDLPGHLERLKGKNLIAQDLFTKEGNSALHIKNAATSLKRALSQTDKAFDDFHCPVLKEVMTDPRIDGCGHTYQGWALTRSLQTMDGHCPLSRQKTHILTQNLLVKSCIEKLLDKGFIPFLTDFNKELPKLANYFLQEGYTLLKEGLLEKAVEQFQLAFRYTKSLKHYQLVLQAFQESKQYQRES